MNIKLQGQPESFRASVKYGIQGEKLLYIPYTGWGNTAIRILYLSGRAVNCPVPRKDWQFGGTGDRHPDGPVFLSLEDAIEAYPFNIERILQEVTDPSAIGGLTHR